MAHVTFNESNLSHSVANIFCIGRNYAAHIAELHNHPEPEPIVFLKPTSALLREGENIILPSFSSSIHYEAELVVLIGKDGHDVSQEEAQLYIAGYAVGLDLTARDTQEQAKKNGLPWAKAKGFKGSACVSKFIAAHPLDDPKQWQFTLECNGTQAQHGQISLMMFDIFYLVSYISRIFGLTAGDLIFTGTPAGVGNLLPGDHLRLNFLDHLCADFYCKHPSTEFPGETA
jgi:2-keto-4-pentenoate hydratase/2-oxohepta-3-ene-1,7-dioic acid hydratase in catechol pathway